MSAIWGIAAPNIGKATHSMFNKMTEVMPFSDKDIVNTLVTESVAIGHSTIGTIHKKGYPLKSKDGSLLALCGIPIWEGADFLKNEIENPTDDRLHDANLVRYACKNDQLVNIGGVYAFADWNPKTNELLLCTDRLGFRCLYYYHDLDNNIIYFSSRLRGLINNSIIKKELNYQTILEFLHFGHPLGNKTFYKRINVLPPGSLIKFSSLGIKKTNYWDIGSISINHKMSYEDAVDLNIQALKKSVARRINRCKDLETILLLSGGADSRRIAGELHRQGIDFKTYTTMGFSSEDSEKTIAAEIARILGKKNKFVELPFENFIEKYWLHANELNDYECCLHQWLLPLVDKIPFKECVNYDGVAGDITLEGVFHASGFADSQQFYNVFSSDSYKKVEYIIGPHPPDVSFLKNDMRTKLQQESLFDSIHNSLKQYEGSENQLTLFFLMNRTRRAINLSSGRILQGKIETVSPFLDYDVLISSLSVPYKYRLKHTLRKRIITKAYPKLAQVPYTQYKQQIPGYSEDLKNRYKRQKIIQLRRNIWKYFLTDNQVIESKKVGLKLLIRLFLTYLNVHKVPYEFSLTYQIFYEWLNKYDIHISD